MTPNKSSVGTTQVSGDGEHSSVLIIDSEADSRESMSDTLEMDGYTVVAVEDKEQAEPMLRSYTDHFGAMLLNVAPKKAKAVKTLEALKSDAKSRNIPVIVVSDEGDTKNVIKSLELGAEDYLLRPFGPDLLKARVKSSIEKKRLYERQASYITELEDEKMRANHLLNTVIPTGIALLSEQNFDRMLETILLESKELCNADGGTLYLRTEDECLEFVIVHTDSLNIAMGGTTGNEITFPTLCMFDEETGEPNHGNVATHVALTGESINIRDAYLAEGFDFAGTKKFDEDTGYRSKSFLTSPLKNDQGRVIGVLQLINALNEESKETIPFAYNLQTVIEALAALAAVALEAYIREQELHSQIDALRIEIDEVKKLTQVREITETDYFQNLKSKAKGLKRKDE